MTYDVPRLLVTVDNDRTVHLLDPVTWRTTCGIPRWHRLLPATRPGPACQSCARWLAAQVTA